MLPKLELLNDPNLPASLEKNARKTAVGQMVMQSTFPIYAFFRTNHRNTRRSRGSGRNKRLEDSSDISDGHLDSDDSEAIVDDHVDDYPDVQSTLGSEDDPAENLRPGRDARTRAKVTLFLIVTAHANYQGRRK